MTSFNNPNDFHEAATDKFYVELTKKVSEEQNDPQAHFLLGLRYINGEDVPKDVEKGFLLVKKAAEMGFADAYHELGVCYYCGEGTEKNLSAAVRWWAEGAAAGNLNSMTNLGLHYTNQKDKKLNEKGIRLLETAAKRGQAEAQCNLGVTYWQGQGIEKNEKEGLKWLEKAAKQKLPNAMFALGLFYKEKLDKQKKAGEKPEVCMENAEKTVDYLLAAAETGFKPAVELLNHLVQELKTFLESQSNEEKTK